MGDTRLQITRNLSISEANITEKFIHSGGPGGQNVNKLSTGVQLRYALRAAAELPERVMAASEKLAGSRLTNDGDIIIQATRFRSREKNRDDARARLVALLKQAAKPPPPKRKPTKPSLSARKKRVDSKVKRGSVKKLRGRVHND
ncbi:MAG: alternative ribosome rescue aminoacyl-tRNA hydrolase ArfB [Pseudomonadota bacterium]